MKIKRYTPTCVVAASLLMLIFQVAPLAGQTTTSKKTGDKAIIDSLQLVIGDLNAQKHSLDSVIEQQKLTNADLRDQMIILDDYRKKLEGNVSSFKGENLKLNQSNRILIVFNSLVAVLLLVTLVFFLRRIGKRKTENEAPSLTVVEKTESPARFVNFEDKLQQLERLGKLREKGFLSEEEFNAEKHMVLGNH